jgi:hypothetical protein
MIAAAWAKHPLFVPRYVVMSLPALAAIAGVALASLPKRIGVILAVFMVAISLNATMQSYQARLDAGDDMRSAVTFVKRFVQPNDAVVVYWGQSIFEFRYYARDSILADLPLGHPTAKTPEELLMPRKVELDERSVQGRSRVWLIVQDASWSTHDPYAVLLSNEIRFYFRHETRPVRFEGIDVILFKRDE